jgi:glycosyltransferase involved in cell wall biosynthesis
MSSSMLFSVIVANYNNGAFLDTLIESIRMQTYTNWQLVIVDDCSADNSRLILNAYKYDPRIVLIFHEHNLGAAAAFKSAADAATGEIIGMLGADDALTPHAIETMLNLHELNPGASLICSNLYQCDEQLNILSLWNKYAAPKAHGILILDPSVGSFATFKKEMYLQTEGFDPFFKKALDHDIYLKLEEKGKVLYHPEPLYLYRANPIGISQNSNWFEATIYSLQARINAYKRRVHLKNILNLSLQEYKQLVQLKYKRLARLSKAQKKLFGFIKYHFYARLSEF